MRRGKCRWRPRAQQLGIATCPGLVHFDPRVQAAVVHVDLLKTPLDQFDGMEPAAVDLICSRGNRRQFAHRRTLPEAQHIG